MKCEICCAGFKYAKFDGDANFFCFRSEIPILANLEQKIKLPV